MMQVNKRKCSAHVCGDRLESHQCLKAAIVERDGKWYCRVHDPEYIKEKNAKWHADFNAKCEVRRELGELRDARAKATEGLTLAELKLVTPELIRQALNFISFEKHLKS